MSNEAATITKITILWAEGTIALADELEGKVVDTVEELHHQLRRVQSDCDHDGYNKVKIAIQLSDGTEMVRRHDVTKDDPCYLQDELRAELRYYRGEGRVVANRHPDLVEAAERLLAIVERPSAESEELACLEAFLGL